MGLISAAPTVRHVAVILDGNRRWAREQRIDPAHAYAQGARRAVELAAACAHRGIDYLTLWALSQENLARDRTEVGPLLDVIFAGLTRIAETGHWRIRHIGDPGLLSEPHRQHARAVTALTTAHGPGTLNIALAYSGRADIVRAVRELHDKGMLTATPNGLAELLDGHLSTGGQPDPDLVIRTSGEHRLSGFMPWQIAYSELYFTNVAWPDFTEAELDKALASFHGRERRYGK